MMNKFRIISISLVLLIVLSACAPVDPSSEAAEPASVQESASAGDADVAEAEESSNEEASEEEADTEEADADDGGEVVADDEEEASAEAQDESVAEPVIGGLPPLQHEIQLPPGFKIGVYADNVPNARSMTLSPNGTLFVGTRALSNVYAILDHDQDYQADEVITLYSGLRSPNGVAYRDGSLYIAEINRVLRVDNIEDNLRNASVPVVVNDTYPTEGHHGWKFIRFGPDGRLYVPVGAPCNVCDTDDSIFSTITSINPDGSDLQIHAEGVRNTVGFDWDPETQDLWFTDNGRDMMGDDMPGDELNHVSGPNMHFGFPYCHANIEGGTVQDPRFTQRLCDEFTPPAQALGPHVAALGMRFYTGQQFPEEYHHQIFIAEHGSWNRTVPIGYRITLARLVGNQVTSYEVFADGWLRDGRAWGRPVDLQHMPDGSLLVSDDAAGKIYRIWYEGE
ncbi:MAG: PQQ-dependent sugar dehydrogenase [Chloroflexota bacterium]